ncbi:phosphate-starvation-inducible PsiE family protein [Thermodesulfovibrio sp.]|uniref:phosphate-starvation-inducible PsiE family protein n=1 Tax=Thermodesulfovibrio sp. TaxID=2067987 RepID=UPI0030B52356
MTKKRRKDRKGGSEGQKISEGKKSRGITKKPRKDAPSVAPSGSERAQKLNHRQSAINSIKISEMFDYLMKFKRLLIVVIIFLLAFVLMLSTVELVYVIIKDIVSPPILLLELDELLEIFGVFMLVIIGIELFESIIKTYLREDVDHVKVVLAVAMIAIAKVIILDIKEVSSLTMLGIAAIILALSIGYYLAKKRASNYYSPSTLKGCEESDPKGLSQDISRGSSVKE